MSYHTHLISADSLVTPYAQVRAGFISMALEKNRKTTPFVGEAKALKGGIDPAGADEHWKTANSALQRVRTAFANEGLLPHTFFIGAAIQKAMAVEIVAQLESGVLSNAANLTNEQRLVAICQWLLTL
jgi:hypothetical protein